MAKLRYLRCVPLSRYRRVANLWNWLPAFRAAAEYESIQRAALALSMSASALSRTVRLLEDAVGVPLFLRSPTGLTLTVEGESLLGATRHAMRAIDDAVHAAQPAPVSSFTVAACGPALPLLLARCVSAQPEMWRDALVRLRTVAADQVRDLLLRGEIDFALVVDAPATVEVTRISVGQLQVSAWGLPNATPTPSIEIALTAEDANHDLEGDRRIHVDGVSAGIELARASRLRLRCPDVLAPPDFVKHDSAPTLHNVFAVMRNALPGQQRAALDTLVAAVQTELQNPSKHSQHR